MLQAPFPAPDAWRHNHLGHWLRLSLERFDARVMALMARHPGVSLGLSNLAARNQLAAAHWHISRHLPPEGARLTELAQRAGMSKQAMGTLVNQCEAWGMVQREPDPLDARARRVCFTPTGRAWLAAYADSVAQAEDELRQAVGAEVATVLALGLEAYSAD
ncbi:MAG: MarR family winged helix-turn-helix transcriptional regulator [Rhodoferax sp.]